MGYPFPSNPVAVDSDSDGYVNYVYNVDTGGQLWRFDFQAKGTYDSSSKTVTANWSGKRIFAPSSPPAEPFFSDLDVAVDSALNRWIYFGSGDREDPLGTGTGILYAIQDKNPNSPYDDANLEDFSGLLLDTDQTTFDTMAKTKNGWFMNMPNTKEKILARPVVFNDQLFFTSFEPTMNLCGGGGVARLYGLRLNLRAAAGTSAAVGAGVLDVTGLSGKQRALIVQGGGIASNPVISMSQDQGAILYLGTTNSSLQAIKVDSPSAFKKLKSWKEWIAQ
jgi:type IV pilus assembly protein PilY1